MGLITNEDSETFAEDNEEVQQARKAQLLAFNQLRITAGETPNATQNALITNPALVAHEDDTTNICKR